MTSIAALDAASQASAATASTSATSKNDAGSQDRFLTLLVTQMKNQDPLNPLDNAQVTSQLAQINTVKGIDKTNTTLADLATRLDAMQLMQSSALVGKTVTVNVAGATAGASSTVTAAVTAIQRTTDGWTLSLDNGTTASLADVQRIQ